MKQSLLQTTKNGLGMRPEEWEWDFTGVSQSQLTINWFPKLSTNA